MAEFGQGSFLGEQARRENHIPQPPTPDGRWDNMSRDHDFFQYNLSQES